MSIQSVKVGHSDTQPSIDIKTTSVTDILCFAGVFFNNHVEHVKFVDFCGKYRLPLLQYLCSTKCIASRDGDEVVSGAMIKKVLLG